MLHSLHVGSIRILTNNPEKVEDLRRHGIKIVGRIPLVVPPTAQNRDYLETKRKKMGHLLDVEQRDELVRPSEGDPR